MPTGSKLITMTLRPVENGTLDDLLQYMQPGAHVAIGRGLAVIESIAKPGCADAGDAQQVDRGSDRG